MGTVGTELLQEFMAGGDVTATSQLVRDTRDSVVPALAELLDYGARIRPLKLHGKPVGFVRGVHTTERRQLCQWFESPEDRVFHLVSLGTTLSPEDINHLDGVELRHVMRLIEAFSEADVTLYPYISAFATTSTSEILWYSRGASVAKHVHFSLELPGGAKFQFLAASEHARLWTGVAALRESSKHRLDETYNAAMITRAMAGRSADKLFKSLKKTQNALQADTEDSWRRLVKPRMAPIDKKDGWGHAMNDDSVEGILREAEGMSKLDKHEQFMETFYKQQMEAAHKGYDETQYLPDPDEVEGISETVSYVTQAQMNIRNARQRAALQDREVVVQEALGAATQRDYRQELMETDQQALVREYLGKH